MVFQDFEVSRENSRSQSGEIAMSGIENVDSSPSEFPDKNTFEVVRRTLEVRQAAIAVNRSGRLRNSILHGRRVAILRLLKWG